MNRTESSRRLKPRTTHHIKQASFASFACGSAALAGAVTLVGAYWAREGSPFCGSGLRLCPGVDPYVALVPIAAAIRGLVMLKRRPWIERRTHGFSDEVLEAVSDAAVGSVAIVVITFMFRSGYQFRGFSYSRLVFVYDWVFAMAALTLVAMAVKAVLAALRSHGHNQRNLVLVGSDPAADRFQEMIGQHPEMGYQLVKRIELPSDERLNIQTELVDVGREWVIDEVVLAVPRLDRRDLSQLVGLAELADIEIRAIPELFGLPPTKVTLSSIGAYPVLDLLQEPLPGSQRTVKRAMDILMGTALLAISAPFMLIAAAAIRAGSKGPILHRQERIGMDGRPFQMLKFRTMVADADQSQHEQYMGALIRGAANGETRAENGSLNKMTDDSRVTSVGRLLRRFSMDEIPQLLNVLRGEMSLVGPRPALRFEVERYQDWHRRRLEVRPGVTGLWQVSGRAKTTFDEMVLLDIQYVENYSPLRDGVIMLRTIPAILRRETG